MKNNAVELPMVNNSSWMPKSMDELIAKALETVKCKPVIKYAVGIDSDYDNKKVFLDENGEILMGYLAFQDVLFHEKGIDGSSIEVYRDIFITSKGRHKIFCTTIERTYDSYGKTNHNRVYRIFPALQTLSLDETDEVIWDLMFEINQNNERKELHQN